MGHYAHRAIVHHHLANHVVRRSNMVHKQESLLCGLLARHTPHYAGGFRPEVSLRVNAEALYAKLELIR